MTSRTSNPPVTTLTRTRTEEAPLFEDQVREYRQTQRRRYNTQRSLQRITRRITGGVFNNSLEQQMDPQVQLRLSMQERASIVPAEVLYHSRRDDAHHRVYMHRSEEAMLVTSNQVDRAFIQPESFNQLQRSGMRFLHMGVIQVRIQILHRQEEGTLALIVFRDNRWQGDQAIFATMEVDLTYGSQLLTILQVIELELFLEEDTIPEISKDITGSYDSQLIMDSSRKRMFSLSTSGGSISTAEGEARYQGIPTPEGPYQLLDQYEELSRGRSPSPRIFGTQEKDLRAHLEDIEWTASRYVLNSI
ncbi:hypothetical protein ZIOFF_043114 [Zingiber officinale]|uniref:Polyprotein n=1 Tax=Zingiber officinale TaxID=94328 RepID=A0A8J5FSQ7_ZINOF|nr:hypothetical protein ZIOFF_043114 [Zingiber officinale]